MILREQKSWTYGSYAALRRSRGLGYWQATFEGRTEVTDSALTELLHQIDRVRTETISTRAGRGERDSRRLLPAHDRERRRRSPGRSRLRGCSASARLHPAGTATHSGR